MLWVETQSTVITAVFFKCVYFVSVSCGVRDKMKDLTLSSFPGWRKRRLKD
jgi:hypothetical protein